MATQIGPGKTVYVRNQIVVDNQVAFAAGERVVVEAIEPNPKAPQYKYVVYSTNLCTRFQLSDNDFCVSPPGEPEVTGGARGLLDDDLPAEQPRVEPSECLHKYYPAEGGKYVCRNCGSVLIPKRAQGADKTAQSEVTSSSDPEGMLMSYETGSPGSGVSQTEDKQPGAPSSCVGCGNPLSDSSFVCGACGAPNIALVKRRATLEERNLKSCHHDYRYTPDQGKICINCAKIVPLKTPVQRRKYATALGESICIHCGVPKITENNTCEKCGRHYADIRPLPKKEYDPKKVRVGPRAAQVPIDGYRQPQDTRSRSQQKGRGPGTCSRCGYKLDNDGKCLRCISACRLMLGTAVAEGVLGLFYFILSFILIYVFSRLGSIERTTGGAFPGKGNLGLYALLLFVMAVAYIYAGTRALMKPPEYHWLHISLGGLSILFFVIDLAIRNEYPALWVVLSILFPLGCGILIIVLTLISHAHLNPLAAGYTKTCPFCAETIREQASVCRYCGRELPKAVPDVGKGVTAVGMNKQQLEFEEAESTVAHICPSCGFEVRAEGIAFCPECGGEMRTA